MIRVLVVDDSSFMRKSLIHILESDKAIKVIDTASDGEETIKKMILHRPDVVLLDIMMPMMDGFGALSYIMTNFPTPVVVLSGIGKKDAAIAIKALEHGAVDFIPKPSGTISYDIEKISAEIISRVKNAAGVNVSKLEHWIPKKTVQPQLLPEARKRIVVIGSSTGGVQAVNMVMSDIPRNLSAAFLVIQHMGKEFIPSFAEWLKWKCALSVSIAQNNEAIRSGCVLIAPGGCHTIIVQEENFKKIHFIMKGSNHGVSPSIDFAMESAAGVYGRDAIGVLLTGMGSDGARGMKAIKEAGGSTIAEDESSCVIFGMPKAAIEMGGVDEIVPLPKIAEAILRKI